MSHCLVVYCTVIGLTLSQSYLHYLNIITSCKSIASGVLGGLMD
jgi:hypothetical protein